MKHTRFALLALFVLLAAALGPFVVSHSASILVGDQPVETQPAERKLLALTFDDGPGSYTGELLDGLAERGARATFFLMGNRIGEDNADLLLRMRDEGHCIASHTFSHPRLHLLTNDQIAEEMALADEAIRAVTGTAPTLLRPPYGNFTTRVQQQIDKPFVLWSVDPEDWEPGKDIGEMIVHILQNSQDGDIILMHELYRGSVVASLSAVDELQARGFEFVTIPELFEARGIPLEPGNYYWSTNHKSHWDRPIFDRDDPYL